MENKTFDARGMACPLPVVNAKKESEEMTNGGTCLLYTSPSPRDTR